MSSPSIFAVVLLASLAPVAGSPADRAGFEGNWSLSSETSDNPFRDTARPTDASLESGRRGPGPKGGDVIGDLPLEVLTDVPWIGITDDGSALKLVYASGRKRVFYTDGDERQLDDGGGPAKVTAKKKGADKIVVQSKWSTGHSLTETWELLSNPTRLSVTGKASGRQSHRYQRVYVPAPPGPPPTPVPTPPPPSANLKSISSPPAVTAEDEAKAATPPAGISTCTTKPPKGTSREDLAAMAKVSAVEAQRIAAASMAPWKVSSVISSEVEVYEGCLVYSFDLRFADKKGVQEVFVDAGDGRVLESTFEGK